MNSHKTLIPEYYREFSCIGSACETTCCSGWNVYVDKSTYEKMRSVLLSKKSGYDAKSIPLEKTSSKKKREYGAIINHANGDCPFLDSCGLCNIHREHGERMLPDTCRHYPRFGYTFSHFQHAAMTMSCPEAARKCLLNSNAMRFVEVDQKDTHCLPVVMSDQEHRPYVREYEKVTGTLISLVGARDIPMSSRFFCVMELCTALKDTFTFKTEANPGYTSVLEGILQTMTEPDYIISRHTQLQNLDAPPSFPLRVMKDFIWTDRTRRESKILTRIFEPTLQGYRAGSGCAEGEEPELEQLQKVYLARRDATKERFGEILDIAMTNYAMNYFLRSPYTTSPNLYEHGWTLLAHFAIIRFALFGHIQMAEILADTNLSKEEADEAFKKHLIEIVVTFSRGFEHMASFVPGFRDLVKRNHFDTPAHVAIFCLF